MNSAPKRLLIIGDSIALGITSITIDDAQTVTPLSYVQQLRERLPNWSIELDAALRRTTTQAKQVATPLIEKYRPQVVLIFLGGNDVDINWKQFILTDGQRVRHNTPLERFEANLRQLTVDAQEAGARVVLSDLPDHDVMERGRIFTAAMQRDVSVMLQSAGGEMEDARRHGMFKAVIEKIAKETGATIVRWTDRVSALPIEQRFGSDGVHPSGTAHEIIADALADLLEAMPLQDHSTTLASAGA